MPRVFKIFGLSAVSMAVCALVYVADAAAVAGRSAYQNVRNVGRMPTMPTLPLNSVGNISANLLAQDEVSTPDVPVVPDNPDEPDVPDEPVVEPTPECPDGGVKNSEYTVDMCMNDVLRCVNNGALPNGLNSLFNEELRNAIVNGMGLCSIQVEKCVSDVRRDCANVYRSSADVWIDFDSRKVQPEYYNFVLRKTGLTPNQAENTCRLLDKNTYGSSFSAVANDGRTTAEYNKTVGAYNGQQGNVLIKSNPQGVKVNDGNPGVDGQRGHYARWDAESATCLIRVAAYNKDEQISNTWLFGALGDDQPAEVWRAAGDTFTCNKDLFGFSLLNDTHTAAVVGIGGGTVVGAGVGAIAGHGKREFDCGREKHREMLTELLKDGRAVGILNEYLVKDFSLTDGVMSPDTCWEVVELFDKYYQFETAIAECEGAILEEIDVFEVEVSCPDDRWNLCYDNLIAQGESYFKHCKGDIPLSPQDCAERLKELYLQDKLDVAEPELSGDCVFKALNLDKLNPDSPIYCTESGKCITSENSKEELKRLDNVFGRDVSELLIKGEKSNMGKSIAVGAAVGAGAGGLATAITAFVERNNISCRIGDGLDQVGFTKSYSIDTLRDFYVKWNLQLPDVIAPTALVNDCQSWKNTCATYNDMNHCRAAQFNYKPAGAKTTTLIHSACAVSGSVCIENYPVTKSYGVCE